MLGNQEGKCNGKKSRAGGLVKVFCGLALAYGHLIEDCIRVSSNWQWLSRTWGSISRLDSSSINKQSLYLDGCYCNPSICVPRTLALETFLGGGCQSSSCRWCTSQMPQGLRGKEKCLRTDSMQPWGGHAPPFQNCRSIAKIFHIGSFPHAGWFHHVKLIVRSSIASTLRS